LQIFKNEDFGEVRVVELNKEPWFVATDICKALDIKNVTQAINRLDEDERSMFNIGRQGETNIVNEYGLYNLILSSRKPEAKKFKRWITHEVIPSIRKHGAYMTPEKIEEVLMNPDTIIQLATALKEEQQRRLQAERQIEEQKPKVLFAEAWEVSEHSILVGEMAKLLAKNGLENMGQNRLFKWLRANGYLHKSGQQYNLPTQKSIELGIIEVKTRTIANPDGSVRVTKTPKVTVKGQIYFLEKFKEKLEMSRSRVSV
jgi:prophage antirepressor-like protein